MGGRVVTSHSGVVRLVGLGMKHSGGADMSKFVHVTADRVRNGMRSLDKLTAKDQAWQAELKELEALERSLREQWERDHRGDDEVDTGKGL